LFCFLFFDFWGSIGFVALAIERFLRVACAVSFVVGRSVAPAGLFPCWVQEGRTTYLDVWFGGRTPPIDPVSLNLVAVFLTLSPLPE
jgi:hypothetical protein